MISQVTSFPSPCGRNRFIRLFKLALASAEIDTLRLSLRLALVISLSALAIYILPHARFAYWGWKTASAPATTVPTATIPNNIDTAKPRPKIQVHPVSGNLIQKQTSEQVEYMKELNRSVLKASLNSQAQDYPPVYRSKPAESLDRAAIKLGLIQDDSVTSKERVSQAQPLDLEALKKEYAAPDPPPIPEAPIITKAKAGMNSIVKDLKSITGPILKPVLSN